MHTNDFEYDSPIVDFIFINYKAIYSGKNRDHKIHSEIYTYICKCIFTYMYKYICMKMNIHYQSIFS